MLVVIDVGTTCALILAWGCAWRHISIIDVTVQAFLELGFDGWLLVWRLLVGDVGSLKGVWG